MVVSKPSKPVKKPVSSEKSVINNGSKPAAKPVTKNKTVEDRGLLDSLVFLKERGVVLKGVGSGRFDSVREAEDASKESVCDEVKSRVTGLRQDLGDLQKLGYDVRLDDIKLLRVPLKLRVWLSSPSRKDLEPILVLLDEVSRKVEPLKKDAAAKEAQKEAQEKAKLQKEKITEQKPTDKKSVDKPVDKKSVIKKEVPVTNKNSVAKKNLVHSK